MTDRQNKCRQTQKARQTSRPTAYQQEKRDRCLCISPSYTLSLENHDQRTTTTTETTEQNSKRNNSAVSKSSSVAAKPRETSSAPAVLMDASASHASGPTETHGAEEKSQHGERSTGSRTRSAGQFLHFLDGPHLQESKGAVDDTLRVAAERHTCETHGRCRKAAFPSGFTTGCIWMSPCVLG